MLFSDGVAKRFGLRSGSQRIATEIRPFFFLLVLSLNSLISLPFRPRILRQSRRPRPRLVECFFHPRRAGIAVLGAQRTLQRAPLVELNLEPSCWVLA